MDTKTYDKIVDYRKEYNKWLDKLRPYHVIRFDRNYRQYTAYSDTQGTEAKISDPVAPELIERVVQRYFQTDPSFYALAAGKNLPQEVTEIIKAKVDNIWNNPKTIQKTGTMRSKSKLVGREFSVIGNAAIETFYNNVSQSPDFRLIPIEDIIFDPTKTLKTARVHYIRNFVDIKYLRDNQEIMEKDKVVTGIFKKAAIDQLEKDLGDFTIQTDITNNRINRSGSNNYLRLLQPIQLLSRWEGKHCCRFVIGRESENNILVQEFDNDVLNDDPLDFIMDIEVPKQPYAFSMLDYIMGLTKAKDLFLNQMVDYGSKVLNPPLFADPNLNPVSKVSLSNAWKTGGLVMVNPKDADHKPMPALGSFVFDMLNYLQQRGESVTGVGGYLGGVPNQANDKTKGTATGIQTLLDESISPVKDRQVNLEEAIIEPFINKALKIAANLMDETEIEDILVSGTEPKWVKVTKGILTGKITLQDLVTAEVISNKPQPQLDQNGQPMMDPQTQQPVMGPSEADIVSQMLVSKGKNPSKEILIDVDWIVHVETGSMSETDAQKDIENITNWAQFRMMHRLPTDFEKVSDEIARRSGIKHPEQYKYEVQPGQEAPGTMPWIMPREVLNFKDLPPSGQIQVAQNAGINLTPEDIMQQNEAEVAKAQASKVPPTFQNMPNIAQQDMSGSPMPQMPQAPNPQAGLPKLPQLGR